MTKSTSYLAGESLSAAAAVATTGWENYRFGQILPTSIRKPVRLRQHAGGPVEIFVFQRTLKHNQSAVMHAQYDVECALCARR